MAIKGLKTPAITSFTGKNTTTNLSAQALGTLTAAQNCMILSDQNVRRAPGYTQLFTPDKFKPSTTALELISTFDFQRSVDGAQYIIVQCAGGYLYASRVTNGVPANPVMLGGGPILTSDAPLLYVPSAFICYATNGTDSIRFVDKNGTLTVYRWGIKQPSLVPTEAITSPPNTGATYAWNFGDAGTGTGATTTHTYAAGGTYIGALQVTAPSGGSITALFTAIINGSAGQPMATCTGPYYATLGQAIKFDASGSKPVISGSLPADLTLSYLWDFGNGETGVGESFLYQYPKDGFYTVTLTVTNSNNISTEITTSAFVFANATGSNKTTIGSSGTTATPQPAVDGPYSINQTATFTPSATGSTDPNGSPLTYSWDFGDGTTATGLSPSKSYNFPGIYTIILTVTNAAGLYSSIATYANVQNIRPQPQPGIYYGSSGSPIAFDATASTNYEGLYLQYGRSYVICFVSKYVDSLGIQRIHVGPPSTISSTLYTGPLQNKQVTLSALTAAADADPQLTNIWVFATLDAPQDTSATYYFLTELPITATSFVDTFFDTFFDQTRLAPFDNFPPPAGTVLARFQSRIFVIQNALMQFSGGAAITLGIPDESFPKSNFFNIPAGAQKVTAMAVLNEGNTLAVSNGLTWFKYTGYDAASFTESDKVASPGQAGPWAGTLTPNGWVYLSPSKRLWIWNGADESVPLELSANVQNPLMGTVSMDDILASTIYYAKVHWFSYGVRHFVGVFARTVNATDSPALATSPTADWLSIWGMPSEGVSGPNALYATDKFPTDYPTCTADVTLAGVPYILTGHETAGMMRFPETFLDNTLPYASTFSHAWISVIEGDARYFWLDIFVDCSDPDAALRLGGPEAFMQVTARVMEAPEDTTNGLRATLLELKRIPKPLQTTQSVFAIRAKMQASGVSMGRYLRVNVTLAKQTGNGIPFDVAVQKIMLAVAPIFQGAP